ncbi:MAG: 4-alpha-glucanotransferase, partial [Clostridiales bacterium]|nr:4-alpha-glucanotransferase [Clostridiales bacterium]
ANEIRFYKMLQYLFFQQWRDLKSYVNEKGIQIIGDVPIYVAGDSADVWANPKQFYLDKEQNPIAVAGCPPDAFSEDGQLWGNPLFRWDVMKKDDYAWWTRRMAAMARLYDVIRIDHFRGFDSYYAIPAGSKTAREGTWKKGPGIALFEALEKKLGRLNIIVEDLGFLTPSVRKLVAASGFPGMKVLQFAFDSREGSDYLPHTYPTHCVVYTGTHDNDTLLGWAKTAPKGSVKFAKEYLNLTKKEGYNWGMLRGAWSSVGALAIAPMQDIIGLGSEARMNTPSTLGGNWEWRIRKGQQKKKLAKRLYAYTKMYGRLVKDEKETEDALFYCE